jgi:hypothetical protein
MVPAAVMITVARTLTLVLVIWRSGGDEPAPPPLVTKTFPTHWDKRIAPLARITAKQRGLDFVHPVPVRFLSRKAFAKAVTRDSDDLTTKDRAELADTTGVLRAFGLVSGDVDLFKSVNRFSGGGVLAFYSYRSQRITVRGHVLTPAVKSTLVHELTHVLQDQNFQIGLRLERLSNHGRDTASSVLRALTEGDARRVQTRYRASLPAPKRAALDASQRRESDAARKRVKAVPPALVSFLTAPYTLGEAMVQTVAARGGNAAVDRLFEHPPVHEIMLIDPFRLLSDRTGARQVARPALGHGEKKIDVGEVGALTWYFMLGERLPLTEALSAVDGWGGDSYVSYRARGTSCVRAAYVGRTATDTDRMYAALRTWVASGSSTTASVRRSGATLRFRTCDPGGRAVASADTTGQAMTLAATRVGIALGVARSGVPLGPARCIAGRLVDDYPVSELRDPSFGVDDPAIQADIRQIALDCR